MNQEQPLSEDLLSNKVILLISTEYWGGGSFLSKHHYARVLSQRGNQVYFLNHGNFKDIKGIEVKQDSKYENIWAINYQFLFRGIRFYPPFLAKIIFKWLSKKIMKAIGKPIDIVWCFDPFRFYDLKLFNPSLAIFHPVDPFSSVNEMSLANSGDLILATSQEILDRYKHVKVPAYTINHGLAEDFLTEGSEDVLLPGKNPIKALYVGSVLRRHIDWPRIDQIIYDHPNVDFVFIGPHWDHVFERVGKARIEHAKSLDALSHVHFLGLKPFEELKNYIASADILLVCYDRENHEDAPPNPHKMMEYFSSGKLIVSNYFGTYEAQQDLLLMAKPNAAFPETFQYALEHLEELNSAELQAKRKAFARENTYVKQVQKIEQLLRSHDLLV